MSLFGKPNSSSIKKTTGNKPKRDSISSAPDTTQSSPAASHAISKLHPPSSSSSRQKSSKSESEIDSRKADTGSDIYVDASSDNPLPSIATNHRNLDKCP